MAVSADATALVATFREEFPAPLFQGDAYSNDIVARALDEALDIHSLNQRATLNCAAHLLLLNAEKVDAAGEQVTSPDGGSGVVRSEQMGPQQRAYLNRADKQARQVFFETTPFGRRFLELESRSARYGVGALVV